MTRSLVWAVLALLALLVPHGAAAEESSEPEDSEPDWTLSASLYTFFVPDADDFGQPTLAVDTADWHLEARYNDEAQRTGSFWSGPNFSVGEEVTFDFTLMFGCVFGEVQGFAPGYAMTLAWWKLELYSDGEYLFDDAAKDDWFFYTWSELTLAPLDWLYFGFVAQRTRAYQTELDLQRGLLLGFAYEEFWFTAHVFDPALDPTVVLALGADF